MEFVLYLLSLIIQDILKLLVCIEIAHTRPENKASTLYEKNPIGLLYVIIINLESGKLKNEVYSYLMFV